MGKYSYDVFISYSHLNADWVNDTLLPRLEKAKLKVCIDYRDFEIGASSPDAIERAVKTSKQTIVVLSPAYIKSGWTKFESLVLQVIDPANANRRLIPVLFEECKIPLRLSTFTYADFAHPKDIDLEWKKLFRALKIAGSKASPKKSAISRTYTSSRDAWHLVHPYAMPPNFTGRVAERTMLTKWLNEDTENRLFILRSLGGFGKSALVWHWLNDDVDPAQWTKVLWWSFYEGDASFENFIKSSLDYLKIYAPLDLPAQTDELLGTMQRQKILLILDGFERSLRAYSSMNAAYQGDEEPKLDDNYLDCVNINATIFLKAVCSLPNIKSKVLITSRLTPRVVKQRSEIIQGCHEEELTALQKEDAVDFFHRQNIKGTRAEIEAACAPYGYHPLCLRLLAGHILKDFEKPGDIIVAQKLKIDGYLIAQQHHILEVSYNILPSQEKELLSTIACFRSPVEFKTLELIAKNKNRLSDELQDLVKRGLLQVDEKNRKIDLHPIVRRYVYERLTALDLVEKHNRLRDYFAEIEVPAKPQTIGDLAAVIEVYHHMVSAREFDKAYKLYRDRLQEPIHFQFGAYDIEIELLRKLFPDGEDKQPRLKDEIAQGWALRAFASCYSVSGRPHLAVSLYERHNELRAKAGSKIDVARGLFGMAKARLSMGAMKKAERNLRDCIRLCHKIPDPLYIALGHQGLGHMLSFCGAWHKAEEELTSAAEYFERRGDFQGISSTEAYRALRFILIVRAKQKSPFRNRKLAVDSASRALELMYKRAHTVYPVERDFVRAHWVLGASYCLSRRLNLAEEHLTRALTHDRAINLVEMEANILLDLAHLRYYQENYNESKSLAEEALPITERCGYVLQGADVNLFLAQYILEQEKDKAKAKEYAKTALKLAYCDGPPYYYKVAYLEAERMLEGLK